jgi:hypothetical protein
MFSFRQINKHETFNNNFWKYLNYSYMYILQFAHKKDFSKLLQTQTNIKNKL